MWFPEGIDVPAAAALIACSLLGSVITAGLPGTWLGVRLLDRLGNRGFGRVFNLLLTALALRLL